MSYAKDRREYNKRKRYYVAPTIKQRNILIRAMWFVTVGWLLGLIWIGLIIMCVFGILTLPLVPGMIHQLGPIMTLERKESLQDREDKLWGVDV